MNIEPAARAVEPVACDVCFEEIPVSEAKNHEASEYAQHYCGLECFARWRAQEEATDYGDEQ